MSAGALFACQVPVFRYALERWEVDPYELVIAPRTGGLTAEEQSALDFLREKSRSVDVPLNLRIRVDQDAENSTNAAVASLFYPGRIRGYETKAIWMGKLTMENARRMVDSPLRRELAKRILHGQSCIWLMVECGDKAKDDAAAAMLASESGRAKTILKIPEGVIGKNGTGGADFAPSNFDNVLQSEVPLKIDFSLLRIKRTDQDEAILLKMLLNLEDDLGEWSNEPMAFPVFGRGRILEPLIGRGITSENIMEHSGYLCGACSCEVKDQNPGLDLLMAVNWDAAIDGSEVVIDKVLPPLEGTAALIAAGKTDEGKGGGSHSAVDQTAAGDNALVPALVADSVPGTPRQEGMLPLRTLLIALGCVVLVVALGTAALRRRRG